MLTTNLVLYAMLLAYPLLAYAQPPQLSLQDQCDKPPFLSVSVSTLTRNNLPAVELRVTDPKGRKQGFGVSTNLIPASRYAEVVQVPKFPDRSRVRAVEVCGADKGEYEVEVIEQGTETYRLAVQVENESLFATLRSQEHRIRRDRFLFSPDPAKGTINLMGIDRNGKPRHYLDDNNW